MKLVVAPVALLLAVASVHAGGFGGPRPFTDQSPLTTGVDGAYTAIARGNNLSGVIRWNYASNRQTTGTPVFLLNGVLSDVYNEYVMFVNGLAYRGLDAVAINGPTISGVLDNGGVVVPNSSDSSDTSDGLTVLTFLSGYFNGNADLNSPEFWMKGDGKVQTWTTSTDSTTSVTTSSPLATVNFSWTGVRNSSSVISESATP